MTLLREKILVEYDKLDGIDFENESEYFGGLPRINTDEWPVRNNEPGTHLLSIRLHEAFEQMIGVAVFFHMGCNAQDAYSLIKFGNAPFCKAPTGTMVMPHGRITRSPLSENEALNYSFVSRTPTMRSGTYPGSSFLAQLTNDILPFPSEAATFYIDLHAPPFWQI